MKISIFGCGWLGLPLAVALKNENHQLKGLVRSSNSEAKLNAAGISSFKGDIENLADIENEFFNCDLLIIALPHKNIQNFKQLKLTIEQSGVQKVLYTSSTSVYQNNNDWVNEQNGSVNNDSIIFKIEETLRQGKFDFTSFRMAGLVGMDRHPGNFFVKSKRKVNQPNAPINLIHIKDCIGIIKAIINQQKWNECYNGCSPDHSIKKEFYPEMAELKNNPAPEFDFNHEPSHKKVDGQKVTRDLNYQYQIQDFVEYFKNQKPTI